MPDPITAITAGVSVYSSYASNKAADKASQRASDAQTQSAQSGIDEQRRQFDVVQSILQPYSQAGTQAIQRQGDIAGIGGPDAQQAIMDQIRNSPLFQAQIEQGENALLQNASATGGLRGGNIQGALAQFNQSLLSDTINQEYGRLGQISGLGQASAAGTAAAAQNTGNQITNLYGQQGQAQAGAAIAQGQNQVNMLGQLAQTGGYLINEWGNSPSGQPAPVNPASINPRRF